MIMFAAACGGSGKPTEFNDTVTENYLEGCSEGLSQDSSFGAVQSVCSCSYRRISSRIEFEEFERLNEELLEDIGRLTQADETDEALNQIRDIVQDCIVECRSDSASADCRRDPYFNEP